MRPIISGLVAEVSTRVFPPRLVRVQFDRRFLRQVFALVALLHEDIARPQDRGVREGEGQAADGQRSEERLAIASPGVEKHREAADRQHTESVCFSAGQISHLSGPGIVTCELQGRTIDRVCTRCPRDLELAGVECKRKPQPADGRKSGSRRPVDWNVSMLTQRHSRITSAAIAAVAV